MSLTVHLSSGGNLAFPNPEQDDFAATVLEWFRDAGPNAVITLEASNMTAHVQRRHITYIEVSR